jgi:hypothetical protein
VEAFYLALREMRAVSIPRRITQGGSMNKHIELARDLRKRINHAYAAQRGTESYERRECAEAIEDLVQRLQAVEAQRDELRDAHEACKAANTIIMEEMAAIAKAQASKPIKTEPPPWWPAVENILKEYGLQAIDFVADFKAAIESSEPAPKECQGCRMAQKYIKQLNEENHKLLSAPKREWVGLTDGAIEAIAREARSKAHAVTLAARELKELNHG